MRFRCIRSVRAVIGKDKYRMSELYGGKSFVWSLSDPAHLLMLPGSPQPERIHGESQGNVGTYTVSSDVWSLGLAMIEMALGHYPYPPETYANVFAQLQAIVHGDPPELPEDKYSEHARHFVSRCLHKIPDKRASYAELLVSAVDRLLLLLSAHAAFTGAPLFGSRQAKRGRYGRLGGDCDRTAADPVQRAAAASKRSPAASFVLKSSCGIATRYCSSAVTQDDGAMPSEARRASPVTRACRVTARCPLRTCTNHGILSSSAFTSLSFLLSLSLE